jgi:hypothetical protein
VNIARESHPFAFCVHVALSSASFTTDAISVQEKVPTRPLIGGWRKKTQLTIKTIFFHDFGQFTHLRIAVGHVDIVHIIIPPIFLIEKKINHFAASEHQSNGHGKTNDLLNLLKATVSRDIFCRKQ